MKKIVALLTSLFFLFSMEAQNLDSLITGVNKKINSSYKDPLLLKPYFIPAFLTSYGFLAMKNEDLKDLDNSIKEEVWIDQIHKPITIDNWLQYAPAFSVFGLRAAGVTGKNRLRDEIFLYLMSNAVM